MTRSTDSRRARNSASVMTGGRRRPDSRPSRRRCRLASRRVEPRTDLDVADGHGLVGGCGRGTRTCTTVFGGSSAAGSPSDPRAAAPAAATAPGTAVLVAVARPRRSAWSSGPPGLPSACLPSALPGPLPWACFALGLALAMPSACLATADLPPRSASLAPGSGRGRIPVLGVLAGGLAVRVMSPGPAAPAAAPAAMFPRRHRRRTAHPARCPRGWLVPDPAAVAAGSPAAGGWKMTGGGWNVACGTVPDPPGAGGRRRDGRGRRR